MTKRGKLKIILDSGVTIWLSLFLLVFICCKNPTSPESEKTEINITVTNECGVAVDIYMDNNLQFSVEYQESRTIQNGLGALRNLRPVKRTTCGVRRSPPTAGCRSERF